MSTCLKYTLKPDISFPNMTGTTSTGRITAVNNALITVLLPYARLGDICYIHTKKREIPAKVVSFQNQTAQLAPLAEVDGLSQGCLVFNTGKPLILKLPKNLLGKVFNVLGEPYEAGIKLENDEPSINILVNPTKTTEIRPQLNQQLITGIRSIDTFCPLAYGQRIGLFAGAGVGKSTLLGMIASRTQADLTVIALVGERSREVPDFLNDVLDKNSLKRAVVVVSTSEESSARRALAPYTATAIAEYFRQQGKNVLLLVDSLTRTARAIREIGLSKGELPIRQGLPASVYSELPLLLERAGCNHSGTITAIYTVLTQYDQAQDALGDEVKSLLDGHIILDPKIAEQGILPAFDISASISRLQNKILNLKQLQDITILKKAASDLKHDKDILLLGGTPTKSLEAALSIEKDLNNFICQTPNEEQILNLQTEITLMVKKYNEALNQT